MHKKDAERGGIWCRVPCTTPSCMMKIDVASTDSLLRTDRQAFSVIMTVTAREGHHPIPTLYEAHGVFCCCSVYKRLTSLILIKIWNIFV